MKQDAFETESETLLLVNPAANRGRAGRVGERVRVLLKDYGIPTRSVLSESVDDAREVLKEAVGRHSRVIAVGGDGLVHHTIQEIAGTSIVLGIVPAGTGNDFATAIQLPTAIDEATDVALGDPTSIDVLKMLDSLGQVRFAATIATAGFSAAVNIRAERLRWPRGSSKYTVATLMELSRLPRYRVEMTIDGQEVERTCLLVAVANTPFFGGGMKIAPEASPSSGSMEVVLIHDTSAFTLLRVLPKTFSGSHVSHSAVEILRGRDIQLEMSPLQSADSCDLRADGESAGSLPQTITVVPGGLQIASATIADDSN